VRPEQVKRIARELIQLYADKFTTNFDENKKAIQSLTNISSAKLRNRVAGYVTRLLAVQVAQTSQSEEAEETDRLYILSYLLHITTKEEAFRPRQ